MANDIIKGSLKPKLPKLAANDIVEGSLKPKVPIYIISKKKNISATSPFRAAESIK